MSNTDDKRTPDGTEALPVDADPTSDWAPRPNPQTPDQQTERLDPQGYTTNPYEAYGGGPTQSIPTHVDPAQNQPTQAYPTYEAYQGQQQPNATQAYPTYEAYQGQQQPNATQAYPTGDPRQPYPPEQPYESGQPGGGKKGPSKGVLVAAVTVAGLLLIAVIGVGALLFSGGDDDTTASAPTTTRALPPAPTPAPSTPRSADPEIVPPDLSQIPGGVGEAIGAAGAAIGSVTSNDGTTLILNGIGGSKVTVTTDASTQVIAIGASSVDELDVGETVLVQGDPGPDGTVAARVIISTTIPNLGEFGGN
jgi:hypothetical protein